MGGVRHELLLQGPCLFHRADEPAGEQNAQQEQEDQRSGADEQAGADQGGHGTAFHGNVHENHTGSCGRVAAQVAQVILRQQSAGGFGAGGLFHKRGPQALVLQVEVAAAQDADPAVPGLLENEIRQQQFFFPVPRTARLPGVDGDGLHGHQALVFQIALGEAEDQGEDHHQDQGGDAHNGADELYAQALQHGSSTSRW